ncbi:MAG: hypothetical protein HGA65_16270 [Oscillochloris sp.]|nr:hypothetical protein [Oscillochloris sp.]
MIDLEMVAPSNELEKAYIKEFLREHGYQPEQLKVLSATQRHDLLCAASMFASARLAEVEAKSHLIEEMHGGEHAI